MSSNSQHDRIIHNRDDVVDQSNGAVSKCSSNNNNKNNQNDLEYKDQIRGRNRAQRNLNEDGHVSNNNIHRGIEPSFKDQVNSTRLTQQKVLTNSATKSQGEKKVYNESEQICHYDEEESIEKLNVTEDKKLDKKLAGNKLKQVQNPLGLQCNDGNLDQVGAFYVASIDDEEREDIRNDTAIDDTIVTVTTGAVSNNPRETLNENDSLHLVTAYEVTPGKSVIVAEQVQTNFVMRFLKEHPYVAVFILLLIIGLLIVLITVVLFTNNHKNSAAASVLISLPTTPPTSSSPTMAPTGQDYVRCFESRDELREAVVSYMLENNNAVTDKYGENIGLWCVSKVQDFSNLFNKYAKGDFQNPYGDVFNEDISQWNTSSATNMQKMFEGTSLFDQDISRWDVSSVETMEGMFSNAIVFNQDLSEWNISSVKILTSMFQYADAFNGNISSWDTRSVTHMDFMFLGASKFNGDLSSWNISSVVTLGSMFKGANSFNGDISTWETSTVEYMDDMFLGASAFTGDLSRWNVVRVKDTSGMFAHALEFNSDISLWNMSNVINSEAMFYNAAKFNQDISGWDVSSVKMMKMMFQEAMSFNQDISRWNVSQVTQMYNMFFNATIFNVSLCPWGLLLPQIVDTDTMFGGAAGCPNTTIDPDMTSNPPGPFCYTCP